MDRYIVAASKSWNRRLFEEFSPTWPGDWVFVSSPEALATALKDDPPPRYIFFPHWSHIVPAETVDSIECVCFHMTDVPYGRGGSPLQNLIVRGHTETKLTALRMDEGLDTGPVYKKADLSLDGTADETLQRAAHLSFQIISWIVENEPQPVPQKGEPVNFRRRKPADGNLADITDVTQLYNHIRMLDAEGYPAAFIETETHCIRFTNAALDGDKLVAEAVFEPKEGKDD